MFLLFVNLYIYKFMNIIYKLRKELNFILYIVWICPGTYFVLFFSFFLSFLHLQNLVLVLRMDRYFFCVFFGARIVFFFSFRIGRKPELYNDLIRSSGETPRGMVKVGLGLVWFRNWDNWLKRLVTKGLLIEKVVY